MKITFSRAHIPAALWGGACIGLALVIVWPELDWGRRLHAPPPLLPVPAAKPVEVPLLPEFVLPPLEQAYTQTQSRPLFVVTRRPAPPPPALAAAKTAMQKGQFILLGVTIAKDVSIALLKESNGPKMYRVKMGTEVNGMKLDKVEAEKVTLTQGDDSEELTLKIQPMTKPAPAPANPAGQQQGQQQGQPGQPAAGGADAAQPAPGVAPAGGTAAVNPNSLLNRRRALRGLPPI
jgi:hypothetical protein